MANILPDLSKPQNEALAGLSRAELEALVLKMAAGQKSAGKLTFKVSEKGALSIYGLGRFPITLYASQFDRLDAAWSDIQAFVKANRSAFATKD